MSSPIDKIILRNFKAFPDVKDGITVNIDGNNVLLYGENGSGKSSIYWSLYTLFKALKKDNEISKKMAGYLEISKQIIATENYQNE